MGKEVDGILYVESGPGGGSVLLEVERLFVSDGERVDWFFFKGGLGPTQGW